MSSRYQLLHTDGTANLDPIRLVLRIGDIPFDDTHVTPSELLALQKECALPPLSGMPMWKVDGVVAACQPQAILRFAASLSRLDFRAATPRELCRGEDAARTAQVILDLSGVWAAAASKGERIRLGGQLLDEGFPFYARRLEALLAAAQSSSFTIGKLTFADVLISCAVTAVSSIAASIHLEDPVVQFPRVQRVSTAVCAIIASPSTYYRGIGGDNAPPSRASCISPPAKPWELVYFAAKGRAHAIRLCFRVGGVAFQDTRVGYDGYHALVAQGALPLDTLPVLRTTEGANGAEEVVVVGTHSGSIMRFVAALGTPSLGVLRLDCDRTTATAEEGAANETEDTERRELLRAEEFSCTLDEVFKLRVQWYHSSSDEEKQAHGRRILDKDFAVFARRLEALLSEEANRRTPFVVAERVTFVDLQAYVVLGLISEIAHAMNEVDPVSLFPKLTELVEAVRFIPAVEGYS